MEHSNSLTGIPIEILWSTLGALVWLTYRNIMREIRSVREESRNLREEAKERGYQIHRLQAVMIRICTKMGVHFDPDAR